ncbi:MAG: ABC transporter permease [Burkholderiales bacterium]|nr:ABC transporter permease [Burkholderiales bacterium]
MPVLLWTDLLLFALIGACLVYARHAARHAHLAAPWLRVRASPTGMAAATVLLAFLGIGVLDSLHFRAALEAKPGSAAPPRYAVEVRSVLDLLAEAVLGRMAGKSEKTYSAPLATHGYARENVEKKLADGRVVQVREHPRLVAGGAHLADPARDRAADVALHAGRGVALGFVIWLALALALLAAAAARRGGGLGDAWRAAWQGAGATPWRAILLTLLVLCVAGGLIATLGSRYHLLGTDKVGQDVLYQALKSVRTALVIGTLTTLVMLPLGVLLGIAAGYFGGWIDDLIQYLYTTLNSIPGVLLIAAAVLMMQVTIDANPDWFSTAAERADFRLLALCFILGMMSWTGLCRLMRGETLKLRELEYVQAARAFGVSRLAIIVRHILPNVMHLVIISAVMDFSGMVLTEAVLSYVGVGVDPSMSSFGSMINAARLEMSREPMVWWSLAAAFVFMLSLVLAANLFADTVRDAFDPRLSSAGRRRGRAAGEAA